MAAWAKSWFAEWGGCERLIPALHEAIRFKGRDGFQHQARVLQYQCNQCSAAFECRKYIIDRQALYHLTKCTYGLQQWLASPTMYERLTCSLRVQRMSASVLLSADLGSGFDGQCHHEDMRTDKLSLGLQGFLEQCNGFAMSM